MNSEKNINNLSTSVLMHIEEIKSRNPNKYKCKIDGVDVNLDVLVNVKTVNEMIIFLYKNLNFFKKNFDKFYKSDDIDMLILKENEILLNELVKLTISNSFASALFELHLKKRLFLVAYQDEYNIMTFYHSIKALLWIVTNADEEKIEKIKTASLKLKESSSADDLQKAKIFDVFYKNEKAAMDIIKNNQEFINEFKKIFKNDNKMTGQNLRQLDDYLKLEDKMGVEFLRKIANATNEDYHMPNEEEMLFTRQLLSFRNFINHSKSIQELLNEGDDELIGFVFSNLKQIVSKKDLGKILHSIYNSFESKFLLYIDQKYIS